ncbi:M20 family metallo-hydrolase [Halomonas sp. EGI 63088]|uniref:M20 family metallo-hydrolase n=2 Tax=Halomonadaceae TaxID=28256 RepID=A0ABS9RWZ6_9GAMM|nr:M20 family metallo-hydrolase [Halomonas flagellata]
MALASHGALARGGVNRQAFTAVDADARLQLMAWAAESGLEPSIDAIGNLFLRLAGTDSTLPPVLTGSHLDTQPAGGKFDGTFGVLAGLEALTAIQARQLSLPRSLELVVWANEEGSRFPPTTMGSSVFAGGMKLDQALAARDDQGMALGDVIELFLARHGELPRRDFGTPVHAYLEAHIEQGPVLERAECSLGIVSGIQGLRWFEIEVQGQEAHAGTTPRAARRDAQAAAMRIAMALTRYFEDEDDIARFTIGRWQVQPGSPNTVAGRVVFTIDFRHPDAGALERMGDAIAPLCEQLAAPCDVLVQELSHSAPIHFPSAIRRLLTLAARDAGMATLELMSGATHDAKWLHTMAPTGMLFVPCEGGVSHNQAESAAPEDLRAGTQVLCNALIRLAGESGAARMPSSQ